MDYSVEILKIVEGAIKLDRIKVINYTSLLANKLEENGDKKVSAKFKKIIQSSLNSGSDLQALSVESVIKIPLDQESRLPMADIIYPTEILETVVLNFDIQNQIDRLFEYYMNADKLVSNGILVPNSILMFGPPGCGKSKLAKYISEKLNLPLVIARLDGLMSSYLGNTSKNIRAVFEYAQKVPCVLFLDEFDAIAKVRDDNNELGELKRVVNSLLQNIDNLNTGGMLIAASNHEHLLDPAVWRRFSFKLKIDKPDFSSRLKLIDLYTKNNKLPDEDVEILSHMFSGFTGAEIEEICNKAMIDAVIREQSLSLSFVIVHYFDFVNLLNSKGMDKLNEKDIDKLKAEYLRNIDKKVFSYACISRIINKSKSHVANLLKE